MKINIKNLKNFWPYFIIIVIALFVYFRWLNLSVFANGDWGFRFSESLRDTLFPSIWKVENFGTVKAIVWRFFYHMSFGFFGWIGFDKNIAEKILVFWPILTLLPIASFLLVKKVTKSNIGAVIGSFVFSYNTYYLAINTQGHLLLTLAGAFGIFAIFMFIKNLEEYKIKYSIITALSLFASATIDLRVTYMTIGVLFLYFVYSYFFIMKKFNLKATFHQIKSAVVPIVIFFLLNVYWLLTYTSSKLFIENNVFDRNLFGDRFWELANAITLYYPFWTGLRPDWFTPQTIPFYFWLIPIIAFLGFYFNRKNKYITFFVIISLIGIFLSKQSGAPFKELYPFLYKNIPGFNAFREASKFYFIVAVGYSVLIGFFIKYIWEKLINNKWQIAAKYFLTILITFILLWNTKPMLTGDIGTIFIPRVIHQDYIILKDFLVKQPEYFRTMWVPNRSHYSINLNQHPSLRAAYISKGMWSDFNQDPETKIIGLFNKNYSNNLLDIGSIKYAVIPVELSTKEDKMFKNINDRSFYINELDKLDYFSRKDIGTQELIVYENEDYRPHIYLTNEMETILKSVPYKIVDQQALSQTQYKVNLENISEKVYLNFSEKFHPNWGVSIGDFHWFNVFWRKNNFLPENDHFENEAKLNSFLIDPEVIKDNFDQELYNFNEDGSVDLKLTIYFKSQSHLYLGLIISVTTLILCLAYLVLLGVRGIKHWKTKK